MTVKKVCITAHCVVFISMKRLFIILFIAMVLPLCAQTTLLVSGPSSGWTGLTVSPDPVTTTFLADPLSDQQTGQGPDDMVGSTTMAGFYVDFGTINGVQSVGFRTYLASYQASGFSGNLRIGIDANADGSADLFFGPSLGGAARTQGIVFQAATGTGNYSPSTTALGNNFGRIAFTADNYNYQTAAAVDPLWVNMGTNTNAALSFSMPVQTLKDTLASLGFTLNDTSYFALLAFTSTQSSAINQDLYGSSGIVSTARFDGPDGGFTDYYNLAGGWKPRPIIPEPSTYGIVFVGLCVAGLFLFRKIRHT